MSGIARSSVRIAVARSVGTVEDVLLVDGFPRQVAPPSAQLVAAPGEVLLLGQQFTARFEPLVVADDLVRLETHETSSWWAPRDSNPEPAD